HLSKLCRKVYMLVRKSTFRASKTMVHRVENTPNIEVKFNVEVKEILGDGLKVNSLQLFNNITLDESKLDVTGIFLAIGHRPNTEVFKTWIDTDEVGYIQTKDCTTKTKVPGVFCCGDAQDARYRQAVTAAGSGCMAALDCERYLSAMEHGGVE